MKTPLLLFLLFTTSWISAQTLGFQYADLFSATTLNSCTKHVTDASGNLYGCGSFKTTTDFDPGAGVFNLTALGSSDGYVTKLDPSGNLIWAIRFGVAATLTWVTAIDVDASGNVYISGSFSGTVDFDPGAGTFTLTATGSSVFVCKLDASGGLLWAKMFDGAGTNLFTTDIAVNSTGDVYSVGYLTLAADFDPDTGSFVLTPIGNQDAYISKLDASGNFVWAKQVGGPSSFVSMNGVDVDASGNPVFTGNFNLTADFDPDTSTSNLTAMGTTDLFVTQFDAAGNLSWTKQMGGTGASSSGAEIYVDASGAVYTTGYWRLAAIDFDPGAGTASLSPFGTYDAYISKLDASGNYVWAKQLGGSASKVFGNSIALDAAGNVFTTGTFYVTPDFDPGAGTVILTAAGVWDTYISKLDPSGNYVYAHQLGGTGARVTPFSISCSSPGKVYVSGNMRGTADFDPDTSVFNLINPAISSNSFAAAFVETVSLPPSSLSPPSAVACAGATKRSLTIEWDTASGADHYEVKVQRLGSWGYSLFSTHGSVAAPGRLSFTTPASFSPSTYYFMTVCSRQLPSGGMKRCAPAIICQTALARPEDVEAYAIERDDLLKDVWYNNQFYSELAPAQIDEWTTDLLSIYPAVEVSVQNNKLTIEALSISSTVSDEFNFSISPTLNKGEFEIQIESGYCANESLRIYSVEGKLQLEQEAISLEQADKIKITPNNLSSGWYLVELNGQTQKMFVLP